MSQDLRRGGGNRRAARGIARRRRTAHRGITPSFVDGIGSKMVFRNMFEHARRLLDGSIVVTLEDAARAMKFVAERNRVIVEGASACAIAAALSGRAGAGKVAAIVSGGNIDLEKFAQLTALPGRMEWL